MKSLYKTTHSTVFRKRVAKECATHLKIAERKLLTFQKSSLFCLLLAFYEISERNSEKRVPN